MSDETPPVIPPAVQPPAAPVAPKLPTHEPAEFEPTQAPEGWPQSAWENYQRTRFDLKQAKAQLGSLSEVKNTYEQQVAAANAAAAKAKADAEKATAALQTQAKRFGQDLVLQKVGGNFGHASVQNLARSEYDRYAQAPAEPADFGTWLTSEDVRADPLLGVHFPKATTSPDEFEDDQESGRSASGGGLQIVDPATGKVIGTLGQGGTLHTGTAPPLGKSGAKWTDQRISRFRAKGEWRAGAIRDGKPVGGSAAWQQFMLDGGKVER